MQDKTALFILIITFHLFLTPNIALAINESVTVISPNGGETWLIGSTQKVTWTSTAAPSGSWVALFLKPSGLIIKQTLPVNGSYDWIIPETYCGGDVCGFPMKPADDYKIEARLYTGPALCIGCSPETPQPTLIASDFSDAPFSIVGKNITVTCTDSDGGLNYGVKGTLNFNNREFYTDFCNERGQLNEMYCVTDNTGYTSQEYNCPNGCKDGACINGSTKPSIAALSPSSGPVGTKVTIIGSGFTPTNNGIRFGQISMGGFSSADGKTLTFTVPQYGPSTCSLDGKVCTKDIREITPGAYNVSVSIVNGTSNALPFTVTAGGCRTGGCSSQLCLDASALDVATTCEWREEYACYQKFGKCEKQSTGKCGWTQTEELVECIGSKRCPQLSPPSPDFCPDGRTEPKYDSNKCIIGYGCVPVYCGSGTPTADCYCRENEIKEEYSPRCPEGLACAAVMLYRCVPVPGTLEVKVPSSFSLSEGQAANVVNYQDVRIKLNGIITAYPTVDPNPSLSETPPRPPILAVKITVSIPGGCGPDADPGCLGRPDFSKDYTISQGETIDVQWLKIRFTGIGISEGPNPTRSAAFEISARMPCPEIYVPVCGVDGKIYSNSCEAKVALIEIAYKGECMQEITIRTASGLSGAVGKYFQAAFVAGGGAPPYSWSVSEGALPPGLQLASPPATPPCRIDSSGREICVYETTATRLPQPTTAGSSIGIEEPVIAKTRPPRPVKQNILWLQGTPTQAGTYKFQLTAKDQNGNKGSGTFVVTVLSNALLEKYLIMHDIGDYRFNAANVRKENLEGTDVNVYAAGYGYKQQVEALVAEFSSREEAERGVEQLKKEKNLREDRINGNNVLVDTSSQQNGVLWTHRNLIIVVSNQYTYVIPTQIGGTGVATQTTAMPVTAPTTATSTQMTEEQVPVTQAASTGVAASQPSKGSAVLCTGDAKLCPDGKTYVGRTGPDCEFAPCPGEGSRKYCGSGTSNADCYCKDGETKRVRSTGCENIKPDAEGKIPACDPLMTYKCVPESKPELPLPVVHAYLKKYPSDLGEEKKEKGVTEEELLDIAFRLENLKRKFDQLQRNAVSLSNYYKSSNDTENAERFAKVADILVEAKTKIDKIKERIRENLDNPEGIIDEIKEGIKDLKSMMRQVILVILGGPVGKEEAAQATEKAQPLFGSV